MDNTDRHILFVENNTKNLGKFFNYLLFRSYPVELVDSAMMALDFIEHQSVSVIVSQVMLMDSDITDLAGKIKKMKQSIPIVAILNDKLAERAIDALQFKYQYCIRDLEKLKENTKLISQLHNDNPQSLLLDSPRVTWSENFVIAIPSEPQYNERLIKYFFEKTSNYQAVKDQENALRMSLTEAIANAIEHGNKFDPQKNILVSFEMDPQHITISIQDQGKGFDSEKQDKSIKELNVDYKTRGRGLLLIRKFMDKVEFISPGNKLIMTKYLNSNGNE